MQGNHDVTENPNQAAVDDCLVTVFSPYAGLLARYWCKQNHSRKVAARAARSFPSSRITALGPEKWDGQSSDRPMLFEIAPISIEYRLINNVNGGFALLSWEEFAAWRDNPDKACTTYPALLDKLYKQTLNRGFNYADFRPWAKADVVEIYDDGKTCHSSFISEDGKTYGRLWGECSRNPWAFVGAKWEALIEGEDDDEYASGTWYSSLSEAISCNIEDLFTLPDNCVYRADATEDYREWVSSHMEPTENGFYRMNPVNN